MKTIRVPVRTNIQLFRFVEVSAVDEAAAVSEVERLCALANEGKETNNPAVAGLTAESIDKAIKGYQPPRNTQTDLQWVPGVIEMHDDVEIDRINGVIVVGEDPPLFGEALFGDAPFGG